MVAKKSSLVILALVLVFGIAVAGCDNPTNNNTGNNSNDNTGNNSNDNSNDNSNNNTDNNNSNNNNAFAALAKFDIVGATNLFIAPAASIASARSVRNASDNRLFKITNEGYVLEVTYEDDNGDPVTLAAAPSSIIVLNKDFIVVSFGYSNNFLVNSLTGAAYVFTAGLPDPDQNKRYYRGEHIGHDHNGNIYFISSLYESTGVSNLVRRLSVKDPDNVVIETVSVPNDTVSFFGVDMHGNIAYEGRDRASHGVLRFRYFNGDIETLPGNTNFSWTTSWTGFNGKLYY